MLTILAIAGLLVQTGPAPGWLRELARAESLQRQDREVEAEAALSEARKTAGRIGAGELPSGLVAFQTGNYYYQRARFLEAIGNLEHAAAVFDRQFGQDHHVSVEAAILLSCAYLETSQVSKAASLLRRHLAAGDRLARADRAALLADLGSVLMHQGRLDEAENAYREALAFFETAPGRQSRERRLIALGNLGGVYLNTGRKLDAVALARQALEALAALPDAPPPLRVKTLANAAAAYTAAKGEPRQTGRLFQSAIQLCERELGPDHFLLGPILANYADFLRSVKRKAEANAARRRGESIRAAFAKANLLGHTVDAGALRAVQRRQTAGAAK